MDQLATDLKHALRRLAASPGFTVAAALSIMLGVGATTAIFSLVNAFLLRPVSGVAEPARVVEVGRVQGGGLDTLSYPLFEDLAAEEELEQLAGWQLTPLAVAVGDGVDASSGVAAAGAAPEPTLGFLVTSNYFATLGSAPAQGRYFTPEEGIDPTAGRPPAGAPVAVVSHRFWQRRLGGDRAAIGSRLSVNGVPVTVIGVAPPELTGHLGPVHPQLYLPLGLTAPGLPSAESMSRRGSYFLLAIGRLAAGSDVERARSAMALRLERLAEVHPEHAEQRIGVEPVGSLPSPVRPAVSLFLAALMAVVALVLLIACVNVAGMLLARSVGRGREMAVRLALGAGRRRLVTGLLLENLLLFLLGGGLGVLAASWATGLIETFRPPLPPPFDLQLDLALDLRVLAFALAVSLVTGLLFGLRPALVATRPQLVPALKGETPAGGRSRLLGRGFLVAGQVALTLTLLVGAGLLLRTLANARAFDPGFDPEGVYMTAFDLDAAGYDAGQAALFRRQLLAEIEAAPGVAAASLVYLPPLGMPARMGLGGVEIEGGPAPADGARSHQADVNVISPGYFETLGIPLLAGRDFTPQDDAAAPLAAVINRTMAERFWADGESIGVAAAVGQSFRMGSSRGGRELYRVVGVAADSRYRLPGEETPSFVYIAGSQYHQPQASLLVKVEPDREAAVLGEIKPLVQRLEPALALTAPAPLADQVAVSFLPQRLAAAVAGLFGAVGLLLAAVGIYGVTAYRVGLRGKEIGLRQALGAGRRDVLALIVRQGMAAPLAGMAVGLALAYGLSRLLGSLLFGIGSLDPASWLVACVVLLTAALLATFVPARRAAAVDPMEVLRGE